MCTSSQRHKKQKEISLYLQAKNYRQWQAVLQAMTVRPSFEQASFGTAKARSSARVNTARDAVDASDSGRRPEEDPKRRGRLCRLYRPSGRAGVVARWPAAHTGAAVCSRRDGWPLIGAHWGAPINHADKGAPGHPGTEAGRTGGSH